VKHPSRTCCGDSVALACTVLEPLHHLMLKPIVTFTCLLHTTSITAPPFPKFCITLLYSSLLNMYICCPVLISGVSELRELRTGARGRPVCFSWGRGVSVHHRLIFKSCSDQTLPGQPFICL
jgi:hypothetical protein